MQMGNPHPADTPNAISHIRRSMRHLPDAEPGDTARPMGGYVNRWVEMEQAHAGAPFLQIEVHHGDTEGTERRLSLGASRLFSRSIKEAQIFRIDLNRQVTPCVLSGSVVNIRNCPL